MGSRPPNEPGLSRLGEEGGSGIAEVTNCHWKALFLTWELLALVGWGQVLSGFYTWLSGSSPMHQPGF